MLAFQYESPVALGADAPGYDHPGYLRSLREASRTLNETHNASRPGSVLTVVIAPTPPDEKETASFPSHLFGGDARVRTFECQWEWPRSAEVLPIDTILPLCAAMHEWLGGDESRAVCLHARGGFESGTASLLRFLTACYLCYAGEHASAADALAAVSSAPPGWVAAAEFTYIGSVLPRPSPKMPGGGLTPQGAAPGAIYMVSK